MAWSWLVIPATSINHQVQFSCSLAAQHIALRPLHPLLLVPAKWQYSWTVTVKRISLPIYDSSYLHMQGVYFLELVGKHRWWCHCALQCEQEQCQYLEGTIEQLANAIQTVQQPGQSWWEVPRGHIIFELSFNATLLDLHNPSFQLSFKFVYLIRKSKDVCISAFEEHV